MYKSPLSALLLILSITCASNAQNQDYKHVLSLNAGLNLFQILGAVDNLGDDASTENLNIKATASYGLTYDYGITKWFSLGAGFAYNKFSMTADVIDLEREDGTRYVGPIDLKLSRNNITLRPLFHYGNSGKIDMYSGFRLGANIWTFGVKADSELAPDDVSRFTRGSGATFAIQVIPFGLRGYVTENISIGFETGIGAPHYAALLVGVRL